MQINFDNNEGFQTLTTGIPITINYYSTGAKQWTIKVTFTDSSVWQCYSPYQVHKAAENYSLFRFQPGAGGSFGGGFDDHEPFTAVSGVHSGADVYIAYTSFNRTNTLRKPLIVVEGFDVSNVLPTIGNYTYRNFINDINGPRTDYDFNSQLDDVAHYDIVFIDFRNGTDDILRNAKLVEQVIAWVNTNKVPNSNNANITEQNVVLGISMGGLVARYALADMTKSNVATDTRLLITHDSPHRGANVPLGLQYLIRMTSDVNLFGYNVRDIYPQYDQMVGLLSQPASQQMLMYRSTSKNTFAFNTFLNGTYRSMVTFHASQPQPTYKFIATSNGSECGTALFAPYQQFLNVELAAGLSIIVASYKFRSTIKAFALPNQGATNEIANLYIKSQFKILFFNVSKTLYNEVAYAPQNHLPIDGAPGGVSPYIGNNPFGFGGAFGLVLENFYMYAGGVVQGNPTYFTFVPTASALDVENYNVQSLSDTYVNGWSPSNLSRAATFIAHESPQIGIGGEFNTSHTRFTSRNAEWLFKEMEGISNTLNCSVNCSPNTSNVSISGPSSLCDEATYSISNLPNGAQVNWEVIGDGAEVSSFSGNQVNITKTDYGYFKLKATTSIGCTAIEVLSDQFSSGNPYFVSSLDAYNDGMGTGSGVLCSDAYNYDNYYNVFTYELNALPPYSMTLHYSIYDQNGLVSSHNSTISSNSGSYVLPLLSPGYYSLIASVSGGPCNQTSEPFELGLEYVNCNNFNRIAVYPNPVSSELKISYQGLEKNETTSLKNQKTTNSFMVKLLDDKGRVQKEGKASPEKDITLQVADLPNGIYYVHIQEGKYIRKQQVIISH